VPTFVIDREHRVTHWNRACESITGVQADELIGTRDHWRAFYDKKRPLIADLILSHALETDVGHLYDGRFRRSTVIDGAFEADRYFPHFGEDGKWLFFTAAPLRDANGKFIGAIETLQDITEQKRAEQALRNSEENFRLMSITDSLTGLFNVRHFYEQIEIEVKRAVRYGRPLSMLLLDLDHFKNLNDVHGHLEGDRALAVAANVIRNNFREHDTAYRYGGEEFTVLLPETDIEAATMLAERLIKTLANTPLTTDFGNVLTMTASVGVAEYVADDTATSLVRRADTGVYEAKRLGRNRVSVMR
jgi:diguanylate cyclase (GGDEF)-like protein